MSSSNPYATSGAVKSEVVAPKANRSGLLACIAIVLACLIAVGMFVSQRNFARMFDEFEVKQPFATLIACSPVIPLGLLAIALAAIVLSINNRYHRFANRWNGMLIISSTFALATYVWGMFSPLLQLISGLSK